MRAALVLWVVSAILGVTSAYPQKEKRTEDPSQLMDEPSLQRELSFRQWNQVDSSGEKKESSSKEQQEDKKASKKESTTSGEDEESGEVYSYDDIPKRESTTMSLIWGAGIIGAMHHNKKKLEREQKLNQKSDEEDISDPPPTEEQLNKLPLNNIDPLMDATSFEEYSKYSKSDTPSVPVKPWWIKALKCLPIPEK